MSRGPLPLEQREKKNERSRERRRNLTREQKYAINAHNVSKRKEWTKEKRDRNRQVQREWVANLSPERRAERVRKHREYKKNLPAQAIARRNEMERLRAAAAPLERREAKRLRDLMRAQTPDGRAMNTAKSSRWAKRNPESVRMRCQKRRALRKGASGSYTTQEWIELVNKYNHTCLRCGRKEPEIKLTVDHVVPLSREGSNDIGNIQPLCYSCNSSKHSKIMDFRSAYAN